MEKLFIKKLNENAIIPTKGSIKSAGYDLYSIVDTIVLARDKAIIPTGLSIEFPSGNYLRIAPRSGLAANSSIDVGAGVVDEDYRGEIKVILFNHSSKDFYINIGDRIAQFIIEKITATEIVVVDELSNTLRNESGFGSTGK